VITEEGSDGLEVSRPFSVDTCKPHRRSGLYAAATDKTNTHCANLVMARLTPTPADIVKQGMDGLDVLQEFGWLRYRTLLAGRM